MSSDGCHHMTVSWWLSLVWWLSPNNCCLMTVTWWLQLHNCTVHNSTAQLIYLHLSTEPPSSTPTSTLHNKLCPVEQSKRFDLFYQIYVVQQNRYFNITTHYHLELKANPKQNCPKNEMKLSWGSFLKFLVRLLRLKAVFPHNIKIQLLSSTPENY